jgi:hypothetical protein
MSDQLRSTTPTMVYRVSAALEALSPAARDCAAARLAVNYAAAIDDNDEGDGVFRFGAKLRLALENLGLARTAGALLLPPPLIGRLRPVDRPRHLSAVPPLRLEVLAA